MSKYLLLDYGGVVADHYCEPYSSQLAKMLGVERLQAQKLVSEKTEHGKAYRLNQIGLEQFWGKIRQDVPNKEFNASLAQDLWAKSYVLNPAVIGMLSFLRNEYGVKTAILMNEDVNRFKYVQGIMDWSKCIDFFVSSHETGYLKPENGAYLSALNKWDVSANQVLYVDDRDTHVNAAIQLGMKGHIFRCYGDLWKEMVAGDFTRYPLEKLVVPSVRSREIRI